MKIESVIVRTTVRERERECDGHISRKMMGDRHRLGSRAKSRSSTLPYTRRVHNTHTLCQAHPNCEPVLASSRQANSLHTCKVSLEATVCEDIITSTSTHTHTHIRVTQLSDWLRGCWVSETYKLDKERERGMQSRNKHLPSCHSLKLAWKAKNPLLMCWWIDSGSCPGGRSVREGGQVDCWSGERGGEEEKILKFN